MKNKLKRSILIFSLLTVFFVLTIIYLLAMVISKGNEIKNNPYNKRSALLIDFQIKSHSIERFNRKNFFC